MLAFILVYLLKGAWCKGCVERCAHAFHVFDKGRRLRRRLYVSDGKKVDLFGSYARNAAIESSDVDLLVEFSTPAVSLLTLSSLRRAIEQSLNVSVDLLHAPLPDDSFLDVDKVVTFYEK